jgi:hypothetical protein
VSWSRWQYDWQPPAIVKEQGQARGAGWAAWDGEGYRSLGAPAVPTTTILVMLGASMVVTHLL